MLLLRTGCGFISGSCRSRFLSSSFRREIESSLLKVQSLSSLSCASTLDPSLSRPQRRWYSGTSISSYAFHPTLPVCSSSFDEEPMTQEEQLKEKQRVASLSDYQKEMELRKLEKDLALLLMKKRINTGELFTIRGQFKALVQDYGMPFMFWYWLVWGSTAILTYSAITIGNVDVMNLFATFDSWTGWHLSETLDPTLGTIGLTLVVNEAFEPLRLPVVVLTTKPFVRRLKRARVI